MMNVKFPDLTTPTQKVIAGFIGFAILIVFYFLLPPLVEIFKNLILLGVMGTIILFAVIIRNDIWEILKKWSWEITKKRISSDPLWAAWRGYDYLVEKDKALKADVDSVTAIRIQQERDLIQLVKDLGNEKANYLKKQEANAPETVLRIMRSKIALLDNRFNNMEPKIKLLKKQEADMIEIYQNRTADTMIWKDTLEAKGSELEMITQLSKASDNASAWLQNSNEMKEFKQSLKQIDMDFAKHAANVESFQRDIAPMINASSGAGLEADGMLLIEQYKKERLLLN